MILVLPLHSHGIVLCQIESIHPASLGDTLSQHYPEPMDISTAAPPPCAATAPHYTRRRPEQGLLYRLIATHLDQFLTMTSADERGLPQKVIAEFRAYLDCGILERGFILRRCLSCGYGHCVGFSCRLRGFCPSCLSKRSAVVAAHLVDHVIPHQPTRQWVTCAHAARSSFKTRLDHTACVGSPHPLRGDSRPCRERSCRGGTLAQGGRN